MSGPSIRRAQRLTVMLGSIAAFGAHNEELLADAIVVDDVTVVRA
jgi:hypothetical protein